MNPGTRIALVALAVVLPAALFIAACGTTSHFDGADPVDPCRAARTGAPPFAGADLAHGARRFEADCSQCHRFSGEKPSQPGPDLHGVVSRRIGGLATFRYSHAFRERSDRWTLTALDRYIEDPEWFVPGTRMSYAGLADPDARRDVIAWLACNGEMASGSD